MRVVEAFMTFKVNCRDVEKY